MNEVAEAKTKELTDCQNWKELVSNIENTLRADFNWDPDQEQRLIEGLIQELDNDTSALITQCLDQLKTSHKFESVWSQVKAAATIFHRIADFHVPIGWAGMEKQAEEALWTAAETCGVESDSTLGQSDVDDWGRHKLCLDSIIFALVNLNRSDQRMEKFFDSKISTYWKAYYILWDPLWDHVDRDQYWKTDSGQKNKLKFYELLAYILENHQTELAQEQNQPKEAWEILRIHADDIPKGKALRQKIYTGLIIYYLKEFYYSQECQEGEEVEMFENILAILGDDAVSFILEDTTNLKPEQPGELLLSVPEFLEKTWNDNKDREKIIQAIVHALNHSSSQVQTEAKKFLRKRAPDEMDNYVIKLLQQLQNSVNQEEAGKLVGDVTRSSSPQILKILIPAFAVWIASDENWTLVEAAAQAIKMTPAAVQALIYELSKGLEDKEELRNSYREKVIEQSYNQALNSLFQTDSSNANAAKTTRDRLNQLPPETQQDYLDDLEKWCYQQQNRSQVYADLLTTYEKTEMDSRERPTALLQLTEDLIEQLSQDRLDKQQLKVDRWLTQLLSQMSDPRFYEAQENQKTYDEIKKNMETYAIETLSKRLPDEKNIDIRENIVKVLANVGGTVAIDSLVRTVTSKEREQEARQELLSEYYLKPSKERSEEASKLLEDAVENAKSTMRLLQRLNLATFVMGAILVLGGVVIAVYNDELGKRLTGILSTLGGLGGIVTIFLRDPLKRIQNAMGNLVQIQTAFTGFVWELNLNGTYIQSQYVAKGILTDDDISKTVQRIDEVMDKTIHLIQVYTEDEYQVGSPNINYLLPTTGAIGTTLTLLGQNLRGEEKPRKSNKYQIAFNHKPVKVEVKAWTNSYIIIDLNQDLLKTLQMGDEPAVHSLWVSAMINGQETNSLLFNLTS